MQIKTYFLHRFFNQGTSTELHALKNISVTFNQGEFIAIIGHTGSGKTTFVEHLNGLSKPDRGWVELIEYETRKIDLKTSALLQKNVIYDQEQESLQIIDRHVIRKVKRTMARYKGAFYDEDGQIKTNNSDVYLAFKKNIKKYDYIAAINYETATMIAKKTRVITNSKRKMAKINEIRRKVGVVFQFAEYQLFEETVLKDIMFGPLNMGVEKAQAKALAHKYITKVGMDQSFLEKSPFDLSGGQKRRVALAGILAMEPDVLILDEPTAGLDPFGARSMLHIFKKLHQEGKTIIIVTHELDNVLEFAKRTLVFKNGTLIKDDETYQVLKDSNFLINNELEPPKLVRIITKLAAQGVTIGRVTNLNELAKAIIALKK